MSAAPLISVITPAYNASEFIGLCIDSVIAQTYSNWEMIIVDDGSVDNTAEVVDAYVKRDSRIKYYHQQNGRQGKARNLGLKHAKGELIAFLDADDLWLYNKLSTQLQELDEVNADVLFSDTYAFRLLEQQCDFKKIGDNFGIIKGDEGIALMLQRNRVPILTTLVKRKAIDAVGGFSEKRGIQNAEDYHLWLKLLFAGYSFYNSPKTLAVYRITNNSATTTDKLATTSVIECLYDLMQSYPEYKGVIRSHLKKWFAASYDTLNEEDKSKSMELIDKNCAYLSKDIYSGIFKSLYKLAGLRYSRMVIKRTLNAGS